MEMLVDSKSKQTVLASVAEAYANYGRLHLHACLQIASDWLVAGFS